jgi:thioredoxin 1
MKNFSIIFVPFLLLVACHSTKKSTTMTPKGGGETITVGGVVFQSSEFLSPILEMAQREKKPVFLEFHAKWCAPCKLMEEDVFTQKPVSDYLNKHFLNFRADFDSENGKRLTGIYEVDGLPTVLFLDPQGVVLTRFKGAAQYSDLKKLGDAALAKMK